MTVYSLFADTFHICIPSLSEDMDLSNKGENKTGELSIAAEIDVTHDTREGNFYKE
jgi:hypothetical protein